MLTEEQRRARDERFRKAVEKIEASPEHIALMKIIEG